MNPLKFYVKCWKEATDTSVWEAKDSKTFFSRLGRKVGYAFLAYNITAAAVTAVGAGGYAAYKHFTNDSPAIEITIDDKFE